MSRVLRSIYSFFVDTIQTFLLAGSIFLILYLFIFRPFQVSGESMIPTFKDKEYIFTNLIGMHFGELKRGDVIVFKSPMDKSKDFIKRVIGTPGDTVSLEAGGVFINGQRLNESSYLSSDVRTDGGSFLGEGETQVVPEGSLFVMGDNRPFSSDSREWGFLKRNDVIGKSFFVYWPVGEARAVTNPYK